MVTLFYLSDRVSDAGWLSADEKALVSAGVAAEANSKEGGSHFSDAFRNGRVWLLGLAYFCLASAIYVVSFWLPTLIRQRGVSDPLDVGFLTAIPYLVAIVAMIWCNARADRMRERRWHTVVPCLLTGAGLVLSAVPTGNMVLAMAALTLATAGAATALSAFWSLPAAFLGGAAAAAGLALVNSLGNIAGFVSTSLVGWMTDLTGSSQSSLYLFGALLFFGAALILTLPARLVNK